MTQPSTSSPAPPAFSVPPPGPVPTGATLSDYLVLLRRYLWVILIGLALGIIGGVIYGTFQEKVYEAFADVLVRALDRDRPVAPGAVCQHRR